MPLLLTRADVERVLAPELCIAAVEDALRQHARGKVPEPGILGMHEGGGSFHVKAGFLRVEGKLYFAAKLNANFPANPGRGLPTIRGAMSVEAVHAQLGEVVAGLKAGRQSDEETIIFDSTGTGLQDVAAAIATYHGARKQNVGTSWSLT